MGEPVGDAVSLLETVPIKGRAPKTDYSRDQFGPAWADVNRNGCDTRNDILNRDLTERTWKAGTHNCVVMTGVLLDPYTARTITFAKAQATAVQIDHVVALSDAWQKGAQGWAASTREQFANDPLNLMAVDGPTNEAKGDGDAATWLPPNKAFRCRYVARQVTVTAAYGLWMTSAEHDVITRILAGCPGEPVATPDALTAAPSATTPEEPAAPTSVATEPPTTNAPGDVYYANCSAARAAGVAPLHVGDPGYRSGLDGDRDGIACE